MTWEVCNSCVVKACCPIACCMVLDPMKLSTLSSEWFNPDGCAVSSCQPLAFTQVFYSVCTTHLLVNRHYSYFQACHLSTLVAPQPLACTCFARKCSNCWVVAALLAAVHLLTALHQQFVCCPPAQVAVQMLEAVGTSAMAQHAKRGSETRIPCLDVFRQELDVVSTSLRTFRQIHCSPLMLSHSLWVYLETFKRLNCMNHAISDGQ